jgi:nicotinamide-nucleotide amidase
MARKKDLSQEILKSARYWGLRIAAAESCTGGMVAAALTQLPGASDVFDCGFVTYSNAAKTRLLGVQPGLIADHGAVSEPVAEAMAEGALQRSDAALAVAVTGIAGPGGSEFKPEGRVCFALAQTGQPTQTQTVEFGAIGRDEVRRAARDHALGLLAQRLTAPV